VLINFNFLELLPQNDEKVLTSTRVEAFLLELELEKMQLLIQQHFERIFTQIKNKKEFSVKSEGIF
jgi:hypothetical protein